MTAKETVGTEGFQPPKMPWLVRFAAVVTGQTCIFNARHPDLRLRLGLHEFRFCPKRFQGYCQRFFQLNTAVKQGTPDDRTRDMRHVF